MNDKLARLSDEKIAAEIARMEAECGCSLPDLSDPSIRERAERLINCPEPPIGRDRSLCLSILA